MSIRTNQRNNTVCLYMPKKRCFCKSTLQYIVYFCKSILFGCTNFSKFRNSLFRNSVYGKEDIILFENTYSMLLNKILTHKKDVLLRLLYNTLFCFGKACFFDYIKFFGFRNYFRKIEQLCAPWNYFESWSA